jgi:mutator family transposase
VGGTSDVLKRLILEMYGGGLSQRDIEYSLEKAVGQFVLSKSAVSELRESLTEEYDSNSQFEFLGGVEREMAVEALEHEGEELRPTGKTEIARQRSQVIKEGLTAH